MISLKRILLVEDAPQDIELPPAVPAEHKLANEVSVARDGVEVLEYLHRRGRVSQTSAEIYVKAKLGAKKENLKITAEF